MTAPSRIQDFLGQLGYTGVFLVMLLETVFAPIPSNVIMPLPGLRAVRGKLSCGGIAAAGTAGVMLGHVA